MFSRFLISVYSELKLFVSRLMQMIDSCGLALNLVDTFSSLMSVVAMRFVILLSIPTELLHEIDMVV